jgi:hypothetical protein
VKFGRRNWQRLDAGAVRHLIFLLGEGDDNNPMAGLFDKLHQPELERLKERSVVSKVTLDALLEELEQAGVLASAAIQRVRAKSDLANISPSEGRDFDRTYDIDSFFQMNG